MVTPGVAAFMAAILSPAGAFCEPGGPAREHGESVICPFSRKLFHFQPIDIRLVQGLFDGVP